MSTVVLSTEHVGMRYPEGMPPKEYQLDTVAVGLIERLEGARRTWIDDPPAARAGLQRITEEGLAQILNEYVSVMGQDAWAQSLRREVLETFLPRYLRLAVAQNEWESQQGGLARLRDPLARLLATAASLVSALVLIRVMRFHPISLLFFLMALVVPVIPEVRSWYSLRRYRAELQSMVNDLERMQQEMGRFVDMDPLENAQLNAARRTVEAAAQRQANKENG